MQILTLAVGTWAEWVAAFAAIAGTVLSIFALKFALAANQTAEQTRKEAKDATEASAARESARDTRDRYRERRELAGNITAWWAADRDEEARRYGVVVSNQSAVNAVFHNVDVRVKSSKGDEHTVHLNVLPPGHFFVQQTFENGRATLSKIPLPVRASDVLDPFTVARDRSIVWIEYADGLGKHWKWSPANGLTERDRATA